jgi:hypothetical protein
MVVDFWIYGEDLIRPNRYVCFKENADGGMASLYGGTMGLRRAHR